jgi:hypothetical protein
MTPSDAGSLLSLCSIGLAKEEGPDHFSIGLWRGDKRRPYTPFGDHRHHS